MSSRTKSTFLVNQRALKALVSTYAFSISDVIPASVKLEVLKCLYAEALALEREKLPRSNIGDFLTVWRFFLEPLVFFLAFTNFAKPVLGGSFN